MQNKPNGQFKLEFQPQAIKAFMKDLSIRKVPGVGRVNERLLESIGIKVCLICVQPITLIQMHDDSDMWRHLHSSRCAVAHGQAVWSSLSVANIPGYRIECGPTMATRGT